MLKLHDGSHIVSAIVAIDILVIKNQTVIELYGRWWRLFTMGNADTKLAFRKAVVHLTTKTQVFCLAYIDADSTR